MGRRSLRALALALIVTSLPATMLAGAQEPAAQEPPCPDFEVVVGVGPVCPRGDGLLEVFDAEGASLGFTHGTDPIPAAEEAPAAAGTTAPYCVGGASGTYHIRVLYARAVDAPDGYATWAPQIRSLVGGANSLVDDAARATSDGARLRVRCASGVVTVDDVVLPTRRADASFATITSDLRTLGYNDGRVKYWVFYDDRGIAERCSCSGTGNVYVDARLSEANANNGNAAAMFAVTYGGNWLDTWLHELAHTMGAVQNGAPYATGALHCYDGYDIMCYDDGGPNGHRYSTSYCSSKVFDCNKNTYFHAHPPASSYLASSWNVGSRLNRFIEFARPEMVTLSCPGPVKVGDTARCTLVADDEGGDVYYTVSWGDGTSSRVPSSGYVRAADATVATHAWSSAATRTVTAYAYDRDGWRSWSGLVTTVKVVTDGVRPYVDLVKPVAGSVYLGCQLRTPGPTYTFAYVDEGCVWLRAVDASGIASIEVALWDGDTRRIVASARYPNVPTSAEFHRVIDLGCHHPAPEQMPDWCAQTPRRGAVIEIVVTDGVGNAWRHEAFYVEARSGRSFLF